MFYEGDLQSGIGKAVHESKLVACFVTDDGEESQLWQNDFLKDESIKLRLADHAVLLKLKAGSEEAGYLAAIFPLPKTPTLVVIRNGELKEYLVSGVQREKFIQSLFVALGGIPSQLSPSTASPPIQQTSSSHHSSSSNTPLPSTPSEPASSSATVSDLLAERRARLDVHKKEQDAREKAKKEAEARARKEALAAAAASDPKASADAKYALMQKKRQQDARDERARILKRVEDDKAERREREAERKAQTAAAKAQAGGESNKAGALQSETKRSPSECALQIRLFDGSTIRSRFPAQGSLRKDVRPWVDEKQEGDAPYTFKHVLTPLPNKNIETSEEERSLQSLGLTPNATLILVPVATFTSAYQPSGIVGRSVSTGYGLVSSGFGAVTGLLGSVLGSGTAAPAPRAEESQAGPSNASAPITNTTNLRTLRDRNDQRDSHQFYNGNSTNFEPRKDDDDGEKQD